jgi:hypothetical protein
MGFEEICGASFWIGSLCEPGDDLVRALLAASPALNANDTAAWGTMWSPSAAFETLARRVPRTWTVLREGLRDGDPLVRAMALSAGRGAIACGAIARADVADAAREALGRTTSETIVALRFVLDAPAPEWSAPVLDALRRHGEGPFPASLCLVLGFDALRRIHEGGALPAEVEAFGRDWLSSHPLAHYAASAAHAMLSSS